MTGPYAAQARMSDLKDTQTTNEILVMGLLFIEMVWWIGGSIVFNFVYSGILGDGSPAEAIFSLLGTLVMWVAVGLTMRFLQGRRWQELVLPVDVSLADCLAVMRWAGGLLLTISLLSVLPYISDAAFTRPLYQWLLILPFALGATFVQTTGEEMYFRGFLQSTLAARFHSPLIWAVLPAIVFGLSHTLNAETLPEQIQIVFYTTIFGLFAADLTARSGTLGAAIGFHFAHNAVIFCLYGFEGSLEAPLALWVFAAPDPYGAAALGEAGATPGTGLLAQIFDPVMLWDTAFLVLELTLLWLAARVAIRA